MSAFATISLITLLIVVCVCWIEYGDQQTRARTEVRWALGQNPPAVHRVDHTWHCTRAFRDVLVETYSVDTGVEIVITVKGMAPIVELYESYELAGARCTYIQDAITDWLTLDAFRSNTPANTWQSKGIK